MLAELMLLAQVHARRRDDLVSTSSRNFRTGAEMAQAGRNDPVGCAAIVSVETDRETEEKRASQCEGCELPLIVHQRRCSLSEEIRRYKREV